MRHLKEFESLGDFTKELYGLENKLGFYMHRNTVGRTISNGSKSVGSGNSDAGSIELPSDVRELLTKQLEKFFTDNDIQFERAKFSMNQRRTMGIQYSHYFWSTSIFYKIGGDCAMEDLTALMPSKDISHSYEITPFKWDYVNEKLSLKIFTRPEHLIKTSMRGNLYKY